MAWVVAVVNTAGGGGRKREASRFQRMEANEPPPSAKLSARRRPGERTRETGRGETRAVSPERWRAPGTKLAPRSKYPGSTENSAVKPLH